MLREQQSFRIVLCVPSGRRRNLEILIPYLLKNRNILDEVHLWINTTNPEDLHFITKLVEDRPLFFKIIRMPNLQENKDLLGQIKGVSIFYSQCIEPKTIYIKCDDDICFIEEGTIEHLVSFRIKHKEPLLVYPNIVNNVILNHLHQRFGCFPTTNGICQWDPFCSVGFENGKMAELIHESFIQHYDTDRLNSYKFNNFILWDYIRTSINFIIFFGCDFNIFKGNIEDLEDEIFLTTTLPKRLGRPNVICGEKLVCHFSYGTQRPYLEAKTTLLNQYKRIMLKETANEPLLSKTGC